VSIDDDTLRLRLSRLTTAQRALLVRRLEGNSTRERPVAAARAPMPKQAPLGLAQDAQGRQVAIYPASNAQQRIWFMQQRAGISPVYCTPTAFELRGPLDAARLQAALQRVIGRHDSLRTTFVMQQDELVQRIASHSSFQLERLSATDRTAATERYIEQAVSTSFDLAAAPPFRVLLIAVERELHVLLIHMHHIIADGWSVSNLCSELSAFYAALGAGIEAAVPQLPVQVPDYSTWQRGWLANGALERQANYWQQRLADAPEPLDWPADRPRPAAESYLGDQCSLPIDRELLAALKARAQQSQCTLFMLLLAAFNVLLQRYTGRTDLLVGVPIANRQRPELQGIIGMLANTLVLRTTVSGEASFEQLLERVKQTALEAYEHQDMPFELLVQQLRVRRDASSNPLFQVTFALQDYPATELRLAGLEVVRHPVSTRTSKFDLSLAVRPVGEEMTATLEFSTELFTAQRASEMLGHWHALLAAIAANPAQRLSALAPLARGIQTPTADVVPAAWNRTQRDYPRDQCIHQLFEQQARATPDATAVILGDIALSYGELDARSSQFARRLRALGVGARDLVALRIDRSIEMIIALLAILKAGGTYWALEENPPPARLQLMLADAQPRLLLFRTRSDRLAFALAAGTPAHAPAMGSLDELIDFSSQHGSTRQSTPEEMSAVVQATDPAYVCFTSGSTGAPKGVVVPHRGVVRLVKGCDYARLDASETLLHLSPLAFDASTFELWGALLNGARLALLPPGAPTPSAIGAAIATHGVTTLLLTTGLFHLMVDERLEDLRPLRQLLTGGEVLSPKHVRQARAALPDCRIVNAYGPTENSVITCCYEVTNQDDFALGVPIGRPIANTQVYILDETRQPVPVGVAGELFAGGDGLACGYLRQPELTAGRFIAHPFEGDPDARLYRSGDRARWRSDGNVEFLGRLDTQVKIRGFRIELGEIEAALRVQAGVVDAVASVRETASGDKQLLAYLTGTATPRPDAAALRARLAQLLPDYMLPQWYLWLDRLPLTASGKVDRQALPAPDADSVGGFAAGAAAAAANARPVNLLELELHRIWQRLLDRQHIGRQDNFFELGGNSLLAARLAAQIDRLLGCSLPIATLFQSPTIESLACRLSSEAWMPPWSSLVPLQTQGTSPPLFFVHGQWGDVFRMVDLVPLLGPDQPCYGVQAVGLDGRRERHTRVEDMAEHYSREIVSFQPHGPIYLAGYSLGGVLAFAVAQQLHRLGRRVALLAVIDSQPVGPVPWFFRAQALLRLIRTRCRSELRRLWKLPLRTRFDQFRRRLPRLWALPFEKYRSRAPLVTAAPPLGTASPQLPGSVEYYEAVALAYRLRPYPGSIDLFLSASDDAQGYRPYWRHLARGGACFHSVPGEHHHLFSGENLPGLANALLRVLQHRQALEATPPPGDQSHAPSAAACTQPRSRGTWQSRWLRSAGTPADASSTGSYPASDTPAAHR